MPTATQTGSSPKFRELLADLGADFAALFHDELDLVKHETRAELRSTVVGLGIAAVFALAALLSFCAAGVLALAPVLHPAWAALAVGGALAVSATGVALVSTRNWRRRDSATLRVSTIDSSKEQDA